MTNNKVTLSFEDLFDDKEDGIINLGSGIKIYKICNDLDDLYTINTKNFNNDEKIVCYVRNVTSEYDNIDSKGAFFIWVQESLGWQEIALGSHSHANKYILDSISNFNEEELDLNKSYTLFITKENDKYDVKWKELNILPDLPVNPSNPMYLSSDGDKITWTNNLVPAQSFKKFSVIVDESNFVSSTIINLLLENFNFNINNDEILLYDSGTLLDIETVQLQNDRLEITITKEAFEIDDKLTLLIIRNGITGFLDNIADEYITKKELINALTDGKLDLGKIDFSKYATLNKLKEYSEKQHKHSEYAIKNHTHDYRYAFINHTHHEYLTRYQVLALLADAAGADGEINVDDVIGKLTTELRHEIDLLINKNYITQENLEKQLHELESGISNPDNIYYNGESLTNVLNRLDNKEINTPKNINLSYHSVTANIGGFKVGDIIYEGMSLDEFVDRLLNIKNNIKMPEIKTKIKIYPVDKTLIEIGEFYKISVLPEFIQNDGGSLESIMLFVETSEGIYEQELQNNKEILINKVFQMLPLEYEIAAKIKIECKYKINSVLPENTIVYEDIINYERIAFAGTLDIKFNKDFVNPSAYIRTLNGFNKSNLIEFNVSNLIKSNTLVIAIPYSWNTKVKDIIYNEQNCSIFDLFEMSSLLIEGDNNSICDQYYVYLYTFNEPVYENMSFKVILECDGDKHE